MNISTTLNRVKLNDLRSLCREFGISSVGNKKLLIKRLLNPLTLQQTGSGLIPNQLEIAGQPYRYIFSFGSNNIKQLLSRCRETEEVKKICCGWRADLYDIVKPHIRAGRAQNFSRSFFSTSKNWGGAVSTLIPNPGHSVRGILVPMPENFLPCLDKFEGVHIGKYSRKLINVALVDSNEKPTGDTIEAIAYTGNIKDQFLLPEEQVAPTEAYIKAVARTMRDYKQLLGQSLDTEYQIDIRRNTNPNVHQTITLSPDQIEDSFDIRKKLFNYEFGNLPIIITSPHGGSASSLSFMDDKGNVITPPIRSATKPADYRGPSYSTRSDMGTNFLAKNLADELTSLSNNLKPYQLKALFARKLVDLDRPVEHALPPQSANNDIAWNQRIYDLYYQTLNEMITDVRKKNPNQPILIIDVHGEHSRDKNSFVLTGINDGLNLNDPALIEKFNRENNLRIDTSNPVSQPGHITTYNNPEQGIVVIPIEVGANLISDKEMRSKISKLLASIIIKKIKKNRYIAVCSNGTSVDQEELDSLTETEIPFIDPISLTPLDVDDIVIIHNMCFGKKSLRNYVATFKTNKEKPSNPLTRQELTMAEIEELEFKPTDFPHTYNLEVSQRPFPFRRY